jgi:hypothetical protein
MSIDILDELDDIGSFLHCGLRGNCDMHFTKNQLLKTLSGLRRSYSLSCLRDGGSNNRSLF